MDTQPQLTKMKPNSQSEVGKLPIILLIIKHFVFLWINLKDKSSDLPLNLPQTVFKIWHSYYMLICRKCVVSIKCISISKQLLFEISDLHNEDCRLMA